MNNNVVENGVKMMNYIRSESSRTYQDVVPVATADNITSLGNILLDTGYKAQMNEFINVLVNRIALTIVRNKSYNNPLAILKKGSAPLGTDIEDIYENPAEAKPYEYSDSAMAQLLRITDPDTHVAYYRLNRRDKYTKTITREGLKNAFISWENFNKFIDSITLSLYSGNYIDEFKYTKDLVDGVYNTGKVTVEVVTKPSDEASAKAFVKKCRFLYSAMSFPSQKYAPYNKMKSDDRKPVTTWTDSDRVVLLIRSDVLSEIDVEVLAKAFNLNKSDFLGRVIPVDEFKNPEVLGIIADEAFFQIYDNTFRFDEFYNANVMAWNEYLHAWGTYAVCPFANAVVLATAESKPVTELTIDGTPVELDLNANPNYKTLNITSAPVDTTSDINYTSSDEEVMTAEKVTNKSVKVTPKKTGKATLKAKADNGISAETEVNVVAN